MIRVTVELLPGGVDAGPGKNEILGVMFLANNIVKSAQTDGKRGDYIARLWKKRNAEVVALASTVDYAWDYKPWGQTKVKDFPRHSYHVWNLVRQALNNFSEKKGSI